MTGCTPRKEQTPNALTVSLLRAGKADAIILLSDSQAVLIDTGEKDDGQKIIEVLEENGIKEIEAMIITHYDQDHVGGAAAVLDEISVKKCMLRITRELIGNIGIL